jgi:hypothetical protein
VGPLCVVLLDPGVELGLGLLERGEGAAGEAVACVAPQPAVHGLARDPVARGDLGDTEPAHDLENCLVALLHDSQLDEHLPALPRSATFLRSSIRGRVGSGLKAQMCNTATGATVAEVPELRRRGTGATVAELPELWNAATGANVESMYRDRTSRLGGKVPAIWQQWGALAPNVI